jgi:hypothetical protein
MAISQAMTTSFKAQILLSVHDFRSSGQGSTGDTFKISLYTSTATVDANSTAYTATNEVTGTNYTAGGNTLTNNGVTATNTNATAGVGWVDFADTTWTTATITARGAMIYNTTPSANTQGNVAATNASVCVLDFGADKTSTAGDFTIVFPTADSANAIIRIA